MSAAKQEVAKRESTDVAKAREESLALAPAVDIYENAQGITVQADMPGVSKDGLSIQPAITTPS
jgi:HSP20 family molecular chaperone IbpA